MLFKANTSLFFALASMALAYGLEADRIFLTELQQTEDAHSIDLGAAESKQMQGHALKPRKSATVVLVALLALALVFVVLQCARAIGLRGGKDAHTLRRRRLATEGDETDPGEGTSQCGTEEKREAKAKGEGWHIDPATGLIVDGDSPERKAQNEVKAAQEAVDIAKQNLRLAKDYRKSEKERRDNIIKEMRKAGEPIDYAEFVQILDEKEKEVTKAQEELKQAEERLAQAQKNLKKVLKEEEAKEKERKKKL